MIKAIIFDFAGVIGADGYWVWLRENLADIEEKKELFHRISERVDKGEISEKEFVGFLSEHTGKSIDKVWPEVRERIIINKELIEIIKELRKNYKVSLLSNFVFEWLNEILSNHRLYELFDEVVISSKYGLIKPEPKIFNKMIDLLGIDKSEGVFIDDRQYNVDASNEMGIKALLYRDNLSLRKDLKVLGVKL